MQGRIDVHLCQCISEQPATPNALRGKSRDWQLRLAPIRLSWQLTQSYTMLQLHSPWDCLHEVPVPPSASRVAILRSWARLCCAAWSFLPMRSAAAVCWAFPNEDVLIGCSACQHYAATAKTERSQGVYWSLMSLHAIARQYVPRLPCTRLVDQLLDTRKQSYANASITYLEVIQEAPPDMVCKKFRKETF